MHTETFVHGDEQEAVPLRLFSPGTQLANRYEIRRALGYGGSAVVYVAWDRELRREIALKVLRSDRMTEAAMKRLRREVAIARDASSANLVRIFDVETSDGAIYLTMELVAGGSLSDKLAASTRLPIDEVIRIGSGIATGLHALHALGIVHRDIKPGNVLLDAEGEVKLGDFGLARHFGSDTRATTTGSVVGTLAYLSPEQALADDIDHRCDLYALGVVVFEMLTGELPFAAASPLGTLLARMKSSPHDVRRLRKDCPRWLARLVARLLERRPEDRHASAEAVLRDLRRRGSAFAPTRVRRAIGYAGAVALLFVLLITVAGARLRRNAFAFVSTPADGPISAMSRGGRTLWQLRGYHPQDASRAVVLEHGHSGEREIAIVLRPRNDESIEATHTLSFLDPQSGQIRRRVRLPRPEHVFGDQPDRYTLGSMYALDLDGDGGEEVVATYIHNPEWPSYTVLYEPRLGRARVVFNATGHHHLAGIADVDGDGHNDLLLEGIHNAYGWYNAFAAVRLQPAANAADGPVAGTGTPDLGNYDDDHLLLWYAYLPRGQQPDGIAARVEDGLVRIRYPDGHVTSLGLDGLPAGVREHRRERAAARRRAFVGLRVSDRLVAAGSYEDAFAAIDAALRDARASGDELLLEAVQLRRGRALVRASRIAEAEAHYEAIARGVVSAPEIAMEAAEELHLHGEVSRAVVWYRRALSSARPNGIGRSRHEFIEGLVLALDELGRRDEGIRDVERYMNVYHVPSQDWPILYREFLRWRAGQVPDIAGITLPDNAIDVMRYWTLELEWAAGATPEQMLSRFDKTVEALEAKSPTRSALLSLHAEVLQRTGRTAEAMRLIRRAAADVRIDAQQTTIARAHASLVRARAIRIAGERF